MKTPVTVALFCLAAFLAIAILADQIFEHVPHSEDEVAYIFQAKLFAQNRLTAPTPQYADAFWSPFVVDYQGQRFGKYPPGWPLLLSLGVRLGAPWLINALLGTATLALIAWLGVRFYGSPHNRGDLSGNIAILAAGLGLVAPGFLFLSSSLLSHSASLFWNSLALASLYFLTGQNRATKEPGRAYAILTGAALGAAFVTRPFAALGIALPVGLFLGTLILRGRLKWTTLLWLALGGLPVAGLLPLYWWTITGQPTFNGYLLVWPYDRLGFGPDIGPQGYSLPDAIFINTRLKLTALATGLFGWPGWSSLLFLPIPFLTHRATRWDWLLLGTIGGMVAIHAFYWAFGGVDGGFPRYYYDALPALLLLTARGILITVDYLRRWQWPVFGRTIPAHRLLVGVIAGFILYNFGVNLPPLLAAQKGKYNITPTPLEVVRQANLREPALILVQNVASWSDFAAPFTANSPTLDGPVVYAIDWQPGLTGRVRQQFADRVCWELHEDTLQRCPELDSPAKNKGDRP